MTIIIEYKGIHEFVFNESEEVDRLLFKVTKLSNLDKKDKQDLNLLLPGVLTSDKETNIVYIIETSDLENNPENPTITIRELK